MDIKSFFSNIVAGIASSLMTYLLMHLTRRYRLKLKFSKLNGRYGQYTIDNERITDWVTEVSYLTGNVILTKGESSDGRWEGRITMNEALPEFGSGIYQYTDAGKNDCGIHQIQVSPSKEMIYVLTTNASHGKNNTFAYIWKRING
jgi:hypothetical protein